MELRRGGQGGLRVKLRPWGAQRCGGGVVAPHVVILPEERVVLHGPLLQLHIQAAPVDGHHLADAAGHRVVWGVITPALRLQASTTGYQEGPQD